MNDNLMKNAGERFFVCLFKSFRFCSPFCLVSCPIAVSIEYCDQDRFVLIAYDCSRRRIIGSSSDKKLNLPMN